MTPKRLARTFFVVLVSLQAFLFNVVFADVSIVKPEGGETYQPNASGQVSMDIVWEDDGKTPSMDEITTFTFTLLYGSNLDMDTLLTLKKDVPVDDITVEDNQYKYTVSISTAKIGNGQYFIQVYAAAKGYGYTNHYTPRFRISSIVNGPSTFTYTADSQPDPEYHLTAGVGGTDVDTRSFTVPYTMQTGVSRFAPMQMQPQSAVTAQTWTRKFPTSSVSLYSTLRKSPDKLTTITPGWSYTLPSDYNYATPAPFPSDNGGWYNPKDRQTLSARKVNLKRN